MCKYHRIFTEVRRRRARDDAEKMELQRIVVKKDKLISDIQAALKSKEGRKDAMGSTHETEIDVLPIEFESVDSPTVP